MEQYLLTIDRTTPLGTWSLRLVPQIFHTSASCGPCHTFKVFIPPEKDGDNFPGPTFECYSRVLVYLSHQHCCFEVRIESAMRTAVIEIKADHQLDMRHSHKAFSDRANWNLISVGGNLQPWPHLLPDSLAPKVKLCA